MERFHWSDIIIPGIIIVILLITITNVIINNTNKRDVLSYTVTDKNIKAGDDTSVYLIYCKDINGHVQVLCVKDTLIWGRFNSSDEYAAIEVGKTYNFTVVGHRIPILSLYPNILEHTLKEE